MTAEEKSKTGDKGFVFTRAISQLDIQHLFFWLFNEMKLGLFISMYVV